jgi:hypothetical protein
MSRTKLDDPRKSPLWPVHSVCIVIGINSYMSPDIPALRYCEKDAHAFSDYARELDYEVFPLIGHLATKREIEKTVLRELCKERSKRTRVIIFIAAHASESAILPYDYEPLDPLATAVHPTDFGYRKLDKEIKCSLLRIVDTCYATSSADRGLGVQEAERMDIYLREPCNILLAAGQKDQKAKEEDGHGVYTRHLLEGLRGAAFRPHQAYITSEDLQAYLKRSMGDAGVTQIPYRENNLDSASTGEFLFERVGRLLFSLCGHSHVSFFRWA